MGPDHMYLAIMTRVGAGISVAAGIPDFRSKQEIPGVPELARRKLKDMFRLSMITASVQDASGSYGMLDLVLFRMRVCDHRSPDSVQVWHERWRTASQPDSTSF